MATSANLLALALLQAAPTASPGDALKASFDGWYTEVEDDHGNGDSRVTGISTDGCTTTITGEKGRWTVDWRKVETVALEDVFVFLQAPGLKIAVVADVRSAADLPKLRGMWTAMRALATRCGGPVRAPDEAGIRRP